YLADRCAKLGAVHRVPSGECVHVSEVAPPSTRRSPGDRSDDLFRVNHGERISAYRDCPAQDAGSWTICGSGVIGSPTLTSTWRLGRAVARLAVTLTRTAWYWSSSRMAVAVTA